MSAGEQLAHAERIADELGRPVEDVLGMTYRDLMHVFLDKRINDEEVHRFREDVDRFDPLTGEPE